MKRPIGRRRAGWWWQRLALALVASLLIPFSGATASAANTPTYNVTIDATAPYGQSGSPQYSYLVSPALPSGASLTGDAECTQVYDNGTTGATESVDGSGGEGLDAGTYYFVTSSCSSDPNYPLAISGLSGSSNLNLLGNVFTVSPDSTVVYASADEATVGGSPIVSLAAVVISPEVDDSEIPGLSLTFDYQNSAGIWLTGVGCQGSGSTLTYSATTIENGDGQAYATCVLTAAESANLLNGDGVFTADFAGTTDFVGSTYNGQLPGAAVSTTQAAINLQNQLNNPANKITITETTAPPGCYNPAATNQHSTGLIQATLGALNCSEIQVVQITTGVVLAVATLVVGEEGEIGLIGDAVDAARTAQGVARAAEYALQNLALAPVAA